MINVSLLALVMTSAGANATDFSVETIEHKETGNEYEKGAENVVKNNTEHSSLAAINNNCAVTESENTLTKKIDSDREVKHQYISAEVGSAEGSFLFGHEDSLLNLKFEYARRPAVTSLYISYPLQFFISHGFNTSISAGINGNWGHITPEFRIQTATGLNMVLINEKIKGDKNGYSDCINDAIEPQNGIIGLSRACVADNTVKNGIALGMNVDITLGFYNFYLRSGGITFLGFPPYSFYTVSVGYSFKF